MNASNLADAPADALDALLARVAQQDRDAFESLYKLTSSRLLGICLRVLNDRSEAEDVLQEVFVSAWSKADQFDAQRAGALAWLGTMARNRCIDRLRAQPPSASRAPIVLAETVADAAPSPASQAHTSSERVRLDTCLEQLEPRRQSLIRTAFFDGATYEELATRAGAPLGSVKSWIRRGLQQLRTCLEA